MNNQIVANRIKTPDGTILQSYHRHDYKTYTDKNGKEYMVDGGLDYTRRFVHDDAPYIDLSLKMNDSFVEIREAFHWGTRGEDGKQPLTWVPLADMTTEHIFAIQDNCKLEPWVKELFDKELEYRDESRD
jgi:hypothetical protein